MKRTEFSPIWARIAALTAAGLISLLSFSYLFTTFVPWDGEGYFLIAFRDYLSGWKLYDHVFAMYGPFAFWTAAATARFASGNVTHDAFRWVLLFIWIATAAILAATVWRWTRRSSLALVIFLLIGTNLEGLEKGVGHPQSWIILAVALLLYIGIDWASMPEKKWKAFLTGALVAIIVLCKINVGVFAFLGIALALSFHLRGSLRTLAVAMSALSAAGFGFAIFLRATVGAERFFALAYLVALALVVGFTFLKPVDRPIANCNVFFFLAGLIGCVCVGIGLTLLTGTTARGLLRGLIIEPALLVKSYHYPFRDAARKGSLVLVTMGAAVAAMLIAKHQTLQTRLDWIGPLKVVSGVVLLCAFYINHRLALTGSLVFLVLMLIDVPSMADEAYSNRVLLASLSLLISLQLFPMAGEQTDWAALLPAVTVVILLSDGLDCVERLAATTHVPRWRLIVPRSIALVFVIHLFLSVGTDAVTRYRRWQTAQPLDLPGAHELRLPAVEAARLRGIVYQLNQNCKTVLTIPGMYSLSLWSGVPPIEEKRFDTWPFLWPDQVEREVLPKLRRSDGGCVLISESTYCFFEHLAVKPGNDELLTDVRQTMTPIASVQDFTLYRASPAKDVKDNAP